MITSFVVQSVSRLDNSTFWKYLSLKKSSTRFLSISNRYYRYKSQATDKKKTNYQSLIIIFRFLTLENFYRSQHELHHEFPKQNFFDWTGFVVGKPPFMSPPNQNMLTFVSSLMLKNNSMGTSLLFTSNQFTQFIVIL